MMVCVYLSVAGTYEVPRGALLMTGRSGQYDALLVGMGAHQMPAEPGSPMLPEHTLGELRTDYGMDGLAPGMADDRKCWLYTDDTEMGDGSNALTMVLVNVD